MVGYVYICVYVCAGLVCVSVGGWGFPLLTSTIVFLICALGSIFLRTVDPPCGAFKERSVCVCCYCLYTIVSCVCMCI